jgi:diguanylate cyclase
MPIAWLPHFPQAVQEVPVAKQQTTAVRDTDAAERLAPQLQAREQELKARLLDVINDWVVVFDERADSLLFANDVVSRRLGCPANELSARLPKALVRQPGHREGDSGDKAPFHGQAQYDTEVYSANGETIGLEIRLQTVRYDGHDVIVSFGRDIGERKRAETTIEQLAYYDPLTSLANRRLFEEHLKTAVAHAKRSGKSVMLAFVDIDRLKSINDSLGHRFGDTVLKETARRLSHLGREGDIVARIGGDEFVLLFDDVGEGGAASIGERIRSALAPPMLLGSRCVSLTASIGIATSERGLTKPETLIQQADIAMYVVKRAGGDGCQIHEAHMADAAVERFELENELRQGFGAGQLEVYYQPLVRLKDKQVVGAEALLRWNHPERGQIPPAVFIPIAEDTGLIGPIGSWVLDVACRQARAWEDADVPELRMSVNVSARQFLHDDLYPLVAACLETSGLAPEHLELEITESTALDESPMVQRTLAALRDLGVQIAIDDFGTGYSSLASIDRLGVDTLKIDRSFIAEMNQRPESSALISAVIELGRNLKLRVIAEGVETKDQLDLLRKLECAEVQGFLFSPAVPPIQFPHDVRHVVT